MPGRTDSPLALSTVSGPERISRELAPDRSHLIGRSLESEVCLLHQNVSRRHAAIEEHDGAWFVTDLESRHGTTLNSVRLEPGQPGKLAAGDLLQIGPWVFRIGRGDRGCESVMTVDDSVHPSMIQPLEARHLGSVAQQRLGLLIECAIGINRARTVADLAELVLGTAISATGFARAAWLEPAGEEDRIEVVAARSALGERSLPSISRSLIRQAQSGRMVRLGAAEITHSHSIAELGIHSALCAPILMDRAVVAHLYLDARGHEAEVRADAAGLCQALAHLCGLALADLKRAELVERQSMLESELAAARAAQHLIFPPADGAIGDIRYAQLNEPGRFVAGDLFDVLTVGDDRVAVLIGDVTGEGVGAAILMASTQAQLNAAIAHGDDPAEAVARVNRYVVEHSASNRFVSMWVGIIDRATRRLTYVDAGHGHWVIRPGGRPPSSEEARGIPLGIEGSFPYQSDVVQLAPTDRLLLLSDGVLEQRSPAGEMFGWKGVDAALAESDSAKRDVAAIFEALHAFAGSPQLDDDTTVASVELE